MTFLESTFSCNIFAVCYKIIPSKYNMIFQFQIRIFGVFSMQYFLEKPVIYRELKMQHFVIQSFMVKLVFCYSLLCPVTTSVIALLFPWYFLLFYGFLEMSRRYEILSTITALQNFKFVFLPIIKII